MMRSMFSGISGLRAHQTMMDVVGNNIANVNTAGFKASVTTFQEALNQTQRGAGAPGADRGGSNPLQIGLGTRVASIDGIFTQGASQVTGRSTDLAIQGDGFFVLDAAGQRVYTRAGNFNFDAVGNLVAPTGARVMGWLADTAGAIDTSTPLQAITLPITQVIEPVATENMSLGGNLPADAADGDSVVSTIAVYDSLGNAHELVITFTKTATDRAWDVTAQSTDDTGALVDLTLSPATITFEDDGTLTAGLSPLTVGPWTPPGGATDLEIGIDLASGSPLVQFGGQPSVAATFQDGSAIGFLRSFSIGDDGTITGQFSNGSTKVLGAVATASFTNPAGLMRAGESQFSATINSGEALVGAPGSGSRGLLSAGTLEMSNVDLAAEFTNMIIAQRGFQANSRIITASDEILSDLVNMKR